jgi:beta-aspartyl-peptidase (threonine type)
MEHRGLPLAEAAEIALAKSKQLGGTGGLIAVDKTGKVALPFNTSGMYRGYLDEGGRFVVEIYRDR